MNHYSYVTAIVALFAIAITWVFVYGEDNLQTNLLTLWDQMNGLDMKQQKKGKWQNVTFSVHYLDIHKEYDQFYEDTIDIANQMF